MIDIIKKRNLDDIQDTENKENKDNKDNKETSILESLLQNKKKDNTRTK